MDMPTSNHTRRVGQEQDGVSCRISDNGSPKYAPAHVNRMVKFMASHDTPFRVLTENGQLQNWEIADWTITPAIPWLYDTCQTKNYLSVGAVCSIVRRVHRQTCREYLSAAEREGLIKLRRNKHSSRELEVVPTKRFQQRVEKRVSEFTDECRTNFGAMCEDAKFPADDLPFSVNQQTF